MRVLRTTNTSFLGEKIIKVNDDPKKNLGVNKALVFVKGTKNNFFITRVVRFDIETEAEMEVWEDGLYEKGKIGDSYLEFYQKQGIVTQYKVEDTPSFNEYKSRSRDRGSRNAAVGSDRRSQNHGSGRGLADRNNGKEFGDQGYAVDTGGEELVLTKPFEKKTLIFLSPNPPTR